MFNRIISPNLTGEAIFFIMLTAISHGMMYEHVFLKLSDMFTKSQN